MVIIKNIYEKINKIGKLKIYFFQLLKLYWAKKKASTVIKKKQLLKFIIAIDFIEKDYSFWVNM